MKPSMFMFIKTKIHDFQQMAWLVIAIISHGVQRLKRFSHITPRPETDAVEAKVKSSPLARKTYESDAQEDSCTNDRIPVAHSKTNCSKSPAIDRAEASSNHDDVSRSLRLAFQAKDFQKVV